MRTGEKNAAITGIGQSALSRDPVTYPFSLAVEACRAAIEDAGLGLADIDGAATWPASASGNGEGMSAAGVGDIKASLGLSLNWYGSGEGAAMFGAIVNAIGAISAGYATHVLCWRAVGERWPASNSAGGNGQRVTGWRQWSSPYWASSPAHWAALNALAHMQKYGVSREQMAAISINQRRNAALNPKAIYREPITLTDYFAARMVTTPFCLFDCDVPINGATAVVVSRLDAARNARHRPVRFEAVGSAATDRMDTWFAREDFPRMVMHDAARMMWSRTDLKPSDVDSAHLYDGFSYLTLLWLEALGFAPEGQSGAFVEDGARIALDGELPLNTNGGQLSEGRTHGFGHLREAVLQLRGDAGDRQVKDAEVAVTGVGGGPYGGCLLLTRDR